MLSVLVHAFPKDTNRWVVVALFVLFGVLPTLWQLSAGSQRAAANARLREAEREALAKQASANEAQAERALARAKQASAEDAEMDRYRARLAKAEAKASADSARSAAPVNHASPGDVVDRLRKLAELKAGGHITESEFAELREGVLRGV